MKRWSHHTNSNISKLESWTATVGSFNMTQSHCIKVLYYFTTTSFTLLIIFVFKLMVSKKSLNQINKSTV